MPALNQFDGAATLVEDIFTDTPNVTPHRAKVVDKRLFDPDVAFKPFDRRFNWKALAESPIKNDPDDMRAGHERDEAEAEGRARERQQAESAAAQQPRRRTRPSPR